jgi:hypothetical protein
METVTIMEEIMLVTNTTLFQRQLSEKEASERSGLLSREEQLEQDCWNGLLEELLPEIVVQPGYGNKLFLWEIRQGDASLHIQLSESTVHLDMQQSIDPYLFLTNLILAN